MTRLSSRISFILAAALLLPLVGVAAPADERTVRAPLQSVRVRKPAPNFALKDASGQIVQLQNYRGKVLLLNFWATWCGGCKLEIPWFQEFETTLGPKRFAVLGVSMDQEGWAAVKPYIEKAKATYRIVLADQPTAEKYAITSMPATFIIDRKGRIAATYTGLVDRSDVETNLRALLSKHPHHP